VVEAVLLETVQSVIQQIQQEESHLLMVQLVHQAHVQQLTRRLEVLAVAELIGMVVVVVGDIVVGKHLLPVELCRVPLQMLLEMVEAVVDHMIHQIQLDHLLQQLTPALAGAQHCLALFLLQLTQVDSTVIVQVDLSLSVLVMWDITLTLPLVRALSVLLGSIKHLRPKLCVLIVTLGRTGYRQGLQRLQPVLTARQGHGGARLGARLLLIVRLVLLAFTGFPLQRRLCRLQRVLVQIHVLAACGALPALPRVVHALAALL